MNLIIEEITLKVDHYRENRSDFSSAVEATTWLSKRLRRSNRELVTATQLSLVLPAMDDRSIHAPDGGRPPPPKKVDDRTRDAPPGKGRKGDLRSRSRERRPPKGAGRGKDRPRASTAEQICFSHDLANGASCPDLATCPRMHLDTTKPEEASRMTRAKASFKGKKH
jgi:hypothetical protein